MRWSIVEFRNGQSSLEFQEFIKLFQVEKLVCRYIFFFLISGNERFRTRNNKAATTFDIDQDGNMNFE